MTSITLPPIEKLDLGTVRKLLWDPEFRRLFPDLKPRIDKFFRNPGCGCNRRLYKTILSRKSQLQEYYRVRNINVVETEGNNNMTSQQIKVINCHIDELEDKLRVLPKGAKQIALARYEDQVTVIVIFISA